MNLCERSRHAGDAVGVTLRSLTSAGVRVNTCVPFVSVIYRRTEIHRGVVYGWTVPWQLLTKTFAHRHFLTKTFAHQIRVRNCRVRKCRRWAIVDVSNYLLSKCRFIFKSECCEIWWWANVWLSNCLPTWLNIWYTHISVWGTYLLVKFWWRSYASYAHKAQEGVQENLVGMQFSWDAFMALLTLNF